MSGMTDQPKPETAREVFEDLLSLYQRSEERDIDERGVLDADLPQLLGEIDDLRARFDAADAWRPIETAPKDGTYILSWGDSPHSDVKMVDVVSWDRDPESGEGWFGERSLVYPTHWRPLPKGPEASE